MACPYYKEPEARRAIGYCMDSRSKIPSKKHQECLCQSDSGIYSDFCPIYAKLRRITGKQSVLKRIFSIGYNAKKQPDEKELENQPMTVKEKAVF